MVLNQQQQQQQQGEPVKPPEISPVKKIADIFVC